MPSSRPDLINSDPQLHAEYTQLLARPMMRFEIFYSDGSSVYGETAQAWAQAPNSDVQLVYWQDHTQQITQIMMLDLYLGKSGAWMEDVDFDALIISTAEQTQVK